MVDRYNMENEAGVNLSSIHKEEVVSIISATEAQELQIKTHDDVFENSLADSNRAAV